MRSVSLAVLLASLSISGAAAGQQSPRAAASTAAAGATHLLKTRDGTTLVGRLLAESADTIRFETAGGLLVLPRARVLELRRIDPADLHDGQYWAPDPHATRLYFGPTGRTLKKGEGYFSDLYLFFVNASVGVTDRVMLGGGMSVFPSSDFSNNVYYLTPKAGLVQGDEFNLAVGALIGFAGKSNGSAGLVYGVATNGTPNASVTYGLGWAYANKNVSSKPVLMLGGSGRISRRLALMSENYIVTGDGTTALVSYGLRFIGDKLTVDFGFWNSLRDPIFPGLPWVGFALKF